MQSLARIAPYFLPHIKNSRWPVIVMFFSYVGGVVGGSVILPVFYREIIDLIAESPNRAGVVEPVMSLMVGLVVTGILYTILYRVGNHAMMRAEPAIIRTLYNDAFNRIGKHSYRFFTDNFGGSLVAKVKRYIRSFETIFQALAWNFLQPVVQVAGAFVVLFATAPFIGMLFLAWCIVFIAVTVFFIVLRRRYDIAEAEADSAVTGALADVMTNIVNVKMFSSAVYESERFGDVTERERRARIKAFSIDNIQSAVQSFFIVALEIGGMYVAVRLWLAGSISTGTVVLVQTYFAVIFGSMWGLGHSISRFWKALNETIEMIDIFDAIPDIRDPVSPESVRQGPGEIVFDRVSFEYDNTPIFRDFSLAIRAGERVGIVGHSGAGKSTITKLILRFADVTDGAILIDGQDIRHVPQDDLRRRVSYVPQDPSLFHRSLKENIWYGWRDASDEEVIEAARRAHAHEFIVGFPEGYDTLVGERGVKLSGGERQRVAIARAILENSPILILDEATSSLDSVSERYIQEALEDLMRGKTTIVIAHRLSTIQHMDRIIVLEGGRIVEEGSHDELLERDGIYRNFWNHQIGGFIQE